MGCVQYCEPASDELGTPLSVAALEEPIIMHSFSSLLCTKLIPTEFLSYFYLPKG
jgi:hypothetical protein